VFFYLDTIFLVQILVFFGAIIPSFKLTGNVQVYANVGDCGLQTYQTNTILSGLLKASLI